MKKFLTYLTAGLFTLTLTTTAIAGGGKVTVKITSMGDQMKFDKSEVSVSEGSEVTVEFKNASTSLKHNWILVEKGTGDKIAMDGMSAGESKSYLPKSKSIIAATKLANPGKTEKVTFKAPKKGSYDFVCTSPGHNMLMKGKFIVK